MTQKEVAEAAGLSRTVYNKLEHGRYANPPLRQLNNCAIVLGVDVETLLQAEWKQWWRPLPGYPPEPADPSALWSTD